MGMYRIRRRWREEAEVYGGDEYWRQMDEEHLSDLSLDEIRELNSLPDAAPRRKSFLDFLLTGILVICVLVFLLRMDMLPALRDFDWGFVARSGQLAKDEALASLKSAVVSVEGAYGSGSGFNLSGEGLIVTNRHVVENNTGVMVIFADGRRFPARDWLFVEGYDLAVAAIRGKDLPHVELAEVLPEVGDDLIFIGNPLGFDWTISEAMLLEIWEGGGEKVLIFAGPVRPGSSGSPLFNAQGQVVGVIYASFADVEDRGLALPVQPLTK